MTTYYVRKTGNNSNAGTSAGAAWLTINHALVTIASGDTVYIGAGVYREQLKPTITPSGTTSIIGDRAGIQTGDAGAVVVTSYTTNDTTAPATGQPTLDLNGKSFFSFSYISFIGTDNANGSCVGLSTGTCHDISFTNCFFDASYMMQEASSRASVSLVGPVDTALNYTIDRCIFGPSSYAINITAPLSTTADYDSGIVISNNKFIAPATHTIIFNTSGASTGGCPSGGKIFGNTMIGGITDALVRTPASTKWGLNNPIKVWGNVVVGSQCPVVSATVIPCITEEANFACTTSGSTAPSAMSVLNMSHAPLMMFGQDIYTEAMIPRRDGSLDPASPMLGYVPFNDVASGVPTTTTGTDATVGTVDWTNPNNAQLFQELAGEAYATVALTNPSTSHYLKCTGFGFSIPTDATIIGIVCEINDKCSLNNTMLYNSVKLVKGGTIGGTDQASGGSLAGSRLFNTADSMVRFGAGNSLWGNTLAPSDVNGSTFGVAIAVQINNGTTQTFSIDGVRLIVYYLRDSSHFVNVDIHGIGRPQAAGSTTYLAAGAFEAHNNAVIDSSTTDGAGNDSYELTGFTTQDMLVPVKNGITITPSIDSQYDAGYAGSQYPQAMITNGGNCGVSEQTVTNAGGGSAAWTTLTFSSITPTIDGVITLRLISRSTSTSGHAWFAAPVVS